MNNDKSKPFDLEAAKRGDPIEHFMGLHWRKSHFNGISLSGNVIVETCLANDEWLAPREALTDDLRMAAKKITVRFRAYLWKDSDGSIRPGIADPKKMPYANPEMGEEFIEWIHADWQEAEITPPEST